MRTLALLSALLLLTSHGKSQPLGELFDQVSTADDQGTESEDKAPMKDEDNSLDQTETEDIDITISLEANEYLARGTAGQRKPAGCYCTRGRCRRTERHSGFCRQNGLSYNLCCR